MRARVELPAPATTREVTRAWVFSGSSWSLCSSSSFSASSAVDAG